MRGIEGQGLAARTRRHIRDRRGLEESREGEALRLNLRELDPLRSASVVWPERMSDRIARRIARKGLITCPRQGPIRASAPASAEASSLRPVLPHQIRYRSRGTSAPPSSWSARQAAATPGRP